MKTFLRHACGGGLLAAVLVFSAFAQDWQEPASWSEVGTVARWSELDKRFHRTYESIDFLDQSQFKVNQVNEYAKTREYAGRLDGITLATWKTLDGKEQDDRAKHAARELKYMVDFRMRVAQQAQRTREFSASGWGQGVSDVKVVGDCLGKLRTATSLDPSNPYAWHLLAYFADIVGDVDRAETALRGARAALDEVPDGALDELRAAVALDLAWLYRDRGDLSEALIELDAAEEWGDEGISSRLLRGLVAAQSGDVETALEIASQLRTVQISSFPPDYRSVSAGPEIADISAWSKKSSNYLQSWILAVTWLREGKVDMAAAAFREYALNDVYPFAKKFWNDAGWIYEVTGRRAMAHKAWSLARIHTDYVPYLVYKPYGANVGALTGRGGDLPYYLGFDRFYLAGSRLAYATHLVETAAATEDEFERQELAARALEQAEICVRSDQYAGQARVLQGQVYYLMGDLNSAMIEVEGAVKLLDERGDRVGQAAVLEDLSRARDEISSLDLANFYGQSGTAEGRWVAAVDPAARQAELQSAFDADATDENRRELARFAIRSGDPAQGRELALDSFSAADLESNRIVNIPAEDMALILEADRAVGDTGLALALVRALEGGAEDPWNDAGLWAMAGFVCIEAGSDADGLVALKRASELDPGNHGLKVQLALMGES